VCRVMLQCNARLMNGSMGATFIKPRYGRTDKNERCMHACMHSCAYFRPLRVHIYGFIAGPQWEGGLATTDTE
jgi:hypothetical protein